MGSKTIEKARMSWENAESLFLRHKTTAEGVCAREKPGCGARRDGKRLDSENTKHQDSGGKWRAEIGKSHGVAVDTI